MTMADEVAESDRKSQLPPDNEQLAGNLEKVSNLLSAQGADRFRVEAYHRAAETLRRLERPAWQIYQVEGVEGLDKLPGVGRSIARALQQLIRGGRWSLLHRLQGDDVAERAFASVPNIGPRLARRIHAALGIETLVELQAAAWDGRLAGIPGMGDKRVQAVRESLAGRGRPSRPRAITDFQQEPPESERQREPGKEVDDNVFDLTDEIGIGELLSVDAEYRTKAESNSLPRVTPRRFNPTAAAWLPVLHTQRGDHHYTALFSNTAHAHAMGTTHDWVVIYLENHQQRGQHGRWTVITSRLGKLKGKRIVRGRENDCAKYYESEV